MRSVLLTLALGALVGCRPEPALPPIEVNWGCGACGCWATSEVVRAEVPELERAKLLGPRELLAEVAVHRARTRGVEPDTSRPCYGVWGPYVLVAGPDRDSVEAAVVAVGGSPRPARFQRRDGLSAVLADLGPPGVSELLRSPAVAEVSSLRPTCGCITQRESLFPHGPCPAEGAAVGTDDLTARTRAPPG
ncbi:hypothetical protein [Rubrivirga marina]|uniref:Uncharacterized protein n=1 Tax=Rubrivirga marina TaxID=1196024 RepID=A0A271J1F6_9BACT|nr:hypothetical protein [Rubrivirga marina]PAP77088.1 hypothetical protein BSZ37_11950 [Rubrivirga marina]